MTEYGRLPIFFSSDVKISRYAEFLEEIPASAMDEDITHAYISLVLEFPMDRQDEVFKTVEKWGDLVEIDRETLAEMEVDLR